MTQHEAALKNYLSKYKHPSETKTDIVNTITQYRNLLPSHYPFVFNDGTQQDLIQLEGTIPVAYRVCWQFGIFFFFFGVLLSEGLYEEASGFDEINGGTYNIPISLWVMDTHPYNPPMVFVKPTNTMQIKPGRYVDANGKVDMPFIREWRYPSSDLLSLVQVLTFIFGEECPVFSRNPGQRFQGPPYPGQPQNPGGVTAPGMPQPPSNESAPPGYPALGYPSYPPYPPTSSYTSQSNPGYPPPPANSGYPQPYPPSTSNPPYPSTQGPPTYTSPGGGYPPVQFNPNPPYPPASNNIGERPQFTTTGTVTEADLRASLLSAVEDKIRRRLKETFAQAQAEMDVLCKTEKDLSEGKQKLDKIISDLDNEMDDLEGNIKLLKEKDSEVKEAIQKMEGQQEVDIDEAVVTTAPLYRQLVDAFAEEQAIEDAIYYLGEALRKNVVELESFLKKVRELSRKQFMLRATIQKCRDKARLPPLV